MAVSFLVNVLFFVFCFLLSFGYCLVKYFVGLRIIAYADGLVRVYIVIFFSFVDS